MANKYISVSKEKSVKLFKGEHFILPKDIGAREAFAEFFWRTPADIILEPYYCDEGRFPSNETLCYKRGENAVIFLKSLQFRIFVARTISVRNIDFDGTDLPLFFHDEACQNSFSICCGSSQANCAREGWDLSLNKQRETVGLFTLEPIFDLMIMTQEPVLNIQHSNFRNLRTDIFNKTNAILMYVDALISISNFKGQIYFEASFIENSFFVKGILNKMKGLRGLYQTLDWLNSTLAKARCTIEISEITVVGWLERFSSVSSFYYLDDFSGNLSIKGGAYSNCSLGFFLRHQKSINNGDAHLRIEEVQFKSNIFLGLVDVSNAFIASSTTKLLISGSTFLDNLFEFTVRVTHVFEMKLSGLSLSFKDRFLLPINGLIITAYSKIVLENVAFSGLSSPKADYSLINIVSEYPFSLETVYTVAKREKEAKFSNDSVTIKDSKFSEGDFLLLSTTSFNYAFVFANIYLEGFNLLIHQSKAFIDTLAESRLLISNVTFTRFQSAVSLIYIGAFLNISVEGLIFENITMQENYLCFFRSLTNSNPAEHQVNITHVTVNRLFIRSKNTEKLGLYIRSAESGKGPDVSLHNSIFSNSFSIEDRQTYAQLFRAHNSNLYIKNISLFNIEYFVFLGVSIRASTANLLITDVHFENSFSKPIPGIINCGVASYRKVEISNSSFVKLLVLQNFAFALNFAQAVLISNCTVNIYQETGSIFFSQVTSLASLLIDNIKIECAPGTTATILTLSTENSTSLVKWQDAQSVESALERLNAFDFGIQRSFFKGSRNRAIAMLPQTEIYIFDSIFRDMEHLEGAFLLASQKSKILVHKCHIENAFSSFMGGAITGESSTFILLRTSINNSGSGSKGGALTFVSCTVYIKECQFSESHGEVAGILFSEDSKTSIINSRLLNSSALLYGGHLAVKAGEIVLTNCILSRGASSKIGGSLLIEKSSFQLVNCEFYLCSTGLGIIYATETDKDSTSFITKVRFQNNTVASTVLLFYDVNLNISLLDVVNQEAREGYLIEIRGTFAKTRVCINFARALNNSFGQGIFRISEVDFFLSSSIFFNNAIAFGGSLWKLENSNLVLTKTNIKNLVSLREKTGFSIFLADKSNLNVKDSDFNLTESQNYLTGILMTSIFIKNVVIREGIANQGGCIKITKSGFFSENVLFIKNTALETGGVVWALDSSVSLLSTIFWENFAFNGGSDLKLLASTNPADYLVQIQNCFFLGILSNSISCQGMRLSLRRTVVFGLGSSGSQALSLKESQRLELISCLFYNLQGESVIMVLNQAKFNTEVIVSYCKFDGAYCPSSNGAFIFLSGFTQARIEETTFANGFAKIGGALAVSCELKSCFIILLNTAFINNRAEQAGGAISSDMLNITKLGNVTFFNNSAPVGNDINYYSSVLSVFALTDDLHISMAVDRDKILNCSENSCNFNEIENKSIKIIPGRAFTLVVLIKDGEGNVQYDQDETYIKIGILNNVSLGHRTHSFSSSIANVKQGIAIFNETSVLGPVRHSIRALLSYKYKKSTIAKIINIEVGDCQRGEGYLDGLCVKCQEHYFSLDPLQKCQECPDKANCPGGDLVIPHVNYWRRDANSSVVVPCKFLDACVDQSAILNQTGAEYVFQCGQGYEGNLCETCVEGFALVKNRCVKCDENGKLMTICMTVSGYIIYLIYVLVEEKRGSDISSDRSVAMMKILLNHVSIFVIFTALKVEWSQFFKDFLAISSMYVSMTPSTIFAFDCIFSWSSNDKIKYTIVMAGISPLSLAALMHVINSAGLMVYFFYARLCRKTPNLNLLTLFKKYSSLKWNLNECFNHLTIIFINIYPLILVTMFNVFTCAKVDNTDKLYLTQFPWVVCSSDFHNRIRFLSCIFLIIWGFFVPVGLIKYVWRSRYVLKNKKVQCQFKQTGAKADRANKRAQQINTVLRFLVRGYKEKLFWWDFVIFMKKFLLICLVTFSEEMDATALGSLGILILSIFLLLSLLSNPYEALKLNTLENFSLLVSISSLGLGTISTFTSEISHELQFACYFVLVSTNIFFFLFWAVNYFILVIREISHNLSQGLSRIFKTLIRSKDKKTF